MTAQSAEQPGDRAQRLSCVWTMPVLEILWSAPRSGFEGVDAGVQEMRDSGLPFGGVAMV